MCHGAHHREMAFSHYSDRGAGLGVAAPILGSEIHSCKCHLAYMTGIDLAIILLCQTVGDGCYR